MGGADFGRSGREVIKVEAPEGGMIPAAGGARRFSMSRASASPPISTPPIAAKKSVTADFRKPEDLARVKALIAEADV